METRNKRLLILGAGRGQVGLYKAAKELGVTTIAGTMPGDHLPCMPLADEVCYMNIINPDEVEEKTTGLQFDGVATCCLDKGLKALGRLCDRRGLPGYSEATADLCNDKLLMKRRLAEQGVNTAVYERITAENELREAVSRIGGYPVIVKATDLAGSKGIYRAADERELLDGFRKAMAETKRDYVIVEKFLQGREFGAQAFISNGRVLFVMPHGDTLFHGSTNVPIGHYVPYECTDELRGKIAAEATKAIRAMGLDNCAVNLDFIEVDGTVYVLELSGRIGANGLPEVTSANYGLDYYKMVVYAALGLSVDPLWATRHEGKAACSTMIVSTDRSGTVEEIRVPDCLGPEVIDLTLFVRRGSEIHKFANSNHCIGQIVVTGPSVAECERHSKEILSLIEIDLQPNTETI